MAGQQLHIQEPKAYRNCKAPKKTSCLVSSQSYFILAAYFDPGLFKYVIFLTLLCLYVLIIVAFFTGNIGVMHFGLVVCLNIPALTKSSMTGFIPSCASGDMGYCRFCG